MDKITYEIIGGKKYKVHHICHENCLKYKEYKDSYFDCSTYKWRVKIMEEGKLQEYFQCNPATYYDDIKGDNNDN